MFRTTTIAGLATVAMALGLLLGACSDDEEVSGTTNTGAAAGTGGTGTGGHSTAGGGTGGGAAQGGSAGGGAWANENSPLGTNLTGISDWSHEWAFVDAFKASRAWISGSASEWDDGRPIDTDEHGWVRSLAAGQIARTVLFWDLVDGYPAGRYVVLYDGQGTMEYWSAATLDSGASSPGRDVIDVDPSQGGIGINITAITSSDPLRNIRVIIPGGVCTEAPFVVCDAENPCPTGSCVSFEDNHATQVFHPLFLDRIKTYRTLRFMDWMDTNGSEQSAWADRPKLDDARWSIKGVPVEILVELANRLHAEPWFTLPHLADDDYITQFAQLVRAELDSSLSVYVEHSNEVWNGMFAQADYARERGLALGLSTDPYQAQLFYHSQRSVEIFQIFESVFGGADRLVRVMGSQAASSWVSEQVLDFGDALAHTDALGIAPYFGGYLGSPSREAEVEAMTLDELFDELAATGLPDATGWMQQSAAIAEDRGVALVAYEAGQHLAGHGGVQDNDVINDLFDAANRDPRMGSLYDDYLASWRDDGGDLMVHFVNCSGYSKWGRWGALEYLPQLRDDAPKFDALQTFIETHTPWW